MNKTVIAAARRKATEAHDKIILEINEHKVWVSDEAASETARRKESVLNYALRQLERDIKHYLPVDDYYTSDLCLIWKSIQNLRLGIESIIRKEESHITY